MTDEETVEVRISRGQRVKALVEDTVVQQVLQDLQAQGIVSFQSAITDDDRRNVWALMNGLAEIKRRFNIIIEDGELALAERERAEKRAAQQRGTGQA